MRVDVDTTAAAAGEVDYVIGKVGDAVGAEGT